LIISADAPQHVLNVGTRAVMDMMGWSSSSMAARYQYVTNDLRHDIANSLGALLGRN